MSKTLAYIALGANLGDPIGMLLDVIDELRELPGCSNLESSGFYSTKPFEASGPDFINAVVSLHTTLSPLELLHALQALENKHGRVRTEHNGPRTLDLDLLVFGDTQMDSPELTLPHPRMHQRAFVLYPLADLAPTLKLAQGTVQDLLPSVADQGVEALDMGFDDADDD
ncbi:2-amino-4-hydroxy-6-hydroxymethyldihydropteridine diphosphokinase [Alcaligenaceae bacterium 429]|nr:2-amino-4-hydroxy-6-hydroxymethyldihydropteridine diphosphokinase [Alcaligenaceae bacterium 429]